MSTLTNISKYDVIVLSSLGQRKPTNRTKQSKTKQNKAKQNKTKQNKENKDKQPPAKSCIPNNNTKKVVKKKKAHPKNLFKDK
ncbi:hypothetical protein RFI_08990 [Reticulomyxa filosa]|uniref:Uncharacterized protein n=1 Tax=Reticulomyxa filosa TaxID=46433 RepID=X6NQZ8_RETFI|nr:hypothetical protein RFI_08990 [Reticulomyxa filosa]|eukprot:ETO28144.1 hypothetical protein RFI_08990 [Reticulomyxa filosa]